MAAGSRQMETKLIIKGEDQSGQAFGSALANLKNLKASVNEFSGALAAAGLGLSFAGLAATLKSVADDLDRVNKSAQKVGISVEGLSALEYAARLSGVEVAELESNLLRMSRSATEAAHGNKEQAATFAALGVQLVDTGGKMKATDALLLELATAFAKFQDGPEKAELAMRVFGRTGAAMIPMLNSGRDGIIQLMDEARRLGVVMDSQAAAAAERFNDNIDRLSTSLRGLAIAAGQDVIPALTEVTNVMAFAAQEGGPLKAAWVGWGGVTSQLVNGTELGQLRDHTKELAAEITKMRAVVEKGAAPIPFSPFQIKFNDETMAKYKAALAKAEAEMKAAQDRIQAILNPPQSAKSQAPQAAADLELIKQAAERLNTELRNLGIDPKRFDLSAAEIVQTFEHIAGNAKATGDQIITALVVSLDKVGKESAPNMAAALAKAFSDGRVSAAQLEIGMSAITTKAEGLWAAMDVGAAKAKALEDAYKTLGITSQEALNAAAVKAKDAFDLIQASGTSVGVLNSAWGKYAEAAIAANGGTADATIKAQAAMHQYAVEVDAAGKAHVKAMGDALAATNALAAGEKARQDALNKANDSKISDLEKTDPVAAEAERQRQAQEALNAADIANAHATINGLHGYKEAGKYRDEAAAHTKRAVDLAGQFKDTNAAEQIVNSAGVISTQAAEAAAKSQELAGYRAGGKVPDAIPMNAAPRMITINLAYGGQKAPVQVEEGGEDAVVSLFDRLKADMARSA